MHQKKNKKILIYIFLFLIIGTLNNKNLGKLELVKINKINITGLSEKKNNELVNDLDYLKVNNLYLISKSKIEQIFNTNILIERYSIFKRYPSTLNIKIEKTKFLAQVKKKNDIFFLGSNGKLIKTNKIRNDMPFIFGNFENKDFFNLRDAINETNFNYSQIKNLFFFKSGRWDIETNDGLLIKLPTNEIKSSLKMLILILKNNNTKKIKKIDLRQNNQIILNG